MMLRTVIKKINIHDILLGLFILIPFLPLRRVPFLIGNTYYFEMTLVLYGMVNLFILVFNRDLRKGMIDNIRKNQVFQAGVILLSFVFLNLIFSFIKCRSFENEYSINEIKIHINIFRVFLEFLFVFIFFQFNLSRAGYFRLRPFITALMLVFVMAVIFPLVYFFIKVDWNLVIKNINNFYKFRNIVLREIKILPDGAHIIFITAWLYLFFIYKKKFLIRIAGLLILGCSLLGIFFAFSRIFLPGFVFISFYLIFKMLKKQLKIIVLCAFVVLLIAGSSMLKSRILAKSKSNYDIGNGRLYVFGSAYGTLAMENSLLSGVGFGNYYYYSYKTIGYKLYRGLTGLHNQGLTFITGSGLMGYILFIYFTGLVIISNRKKIRILEGENKIFRQSLQGIFYTFLMMSLFGDMLFSFHPPMIHYQLYVWMFMSIMASDQEFSQEKADNPQID